MAAEAPKTGEGIPFQEAIDYWRQKTRIPTERWDDLMGAAHVRAFTVAGAARDDMLADFQTAIGKALTEGTGFRQFQKDFDAIVARYGWDHKGDREWRARVIYRTNLTVARSAGRYAQLTDPEVLADRPYWRYVHTHVAHPRPQHLAWNGLTLRADDDWFSTNYPPNGFGCRCRIEAISERQLKASGKHGPDTAPPLDPQPYRDRRTGETLTTPKGVDPGWAYNPGQSWLRGVVPTQLQKPLPPLSTRLDAAGHVTKAPPESLPPLPAHTVDATKILPPGQSDEAYIDAFLQEFGASRTNAVLWRDPSGTVLTISAELFRAAGGWIKVAKFGRGIYMRLLAEALKDPDEIWADWGEGPTGPVLRRRYVRRAALPKHGGLLSIFEWSGAGWFGTTAFPPDKGSYLEGQRVGALLYRRPVK